MIELFLPFVLLSQALLSQQLTYCHSSASPLVAHDALSFLLFWENIVYGVKYIIVYFNVSMAEESLSFESYIG